MKLILRVLGFYLNTLSYIAPKLAGKHGFNIFCFPNKVKLGEKQKAFLHKATYKTVHLPDYDIKIFKWGTGSKNVLLLHGWQSNSFRWKRYLKEFDLNEYTFYAFDAPGHGISPGTILNLVIYGQTLNKILNKLPPINTIIAHSMGAFASLFNFHEFENPQIDKLILLGSPGEVSDFVEFYQKLLHLNNRVFTLISSYFLKRYGYHFQYFSAKKFAQSLDMNGLIIHDEKDKEAPLHHAIDIHKAWEKSKLIITQNMGHKLNKSEIIQMLKSALAEEEIAFKPKEKLSKVLS